MKTISDMRRNMSKVVRLVLWQKREMDRLIGSYCLYILSMLVGDMPQYKFLTRPMFRLFFSGIEAASALV